MPVRVGSATALFASDVVEGIYYAINMKADVLSNSYSGYQDSIFLRDAVRLADEAGVIFVAAAGNDNINLDDTPAFPACYEFDNVISVGATDSLDNNVFNWGPTTVHLGAPGDRILSTVPYDTGGSKYALYSGTSMAVPFVAGACAPRQGGVPLAVTPPVKAMCPGRRRHFQATLRAVRDKRQAQPLQDRHISQDHRRPMTAHSGSGIFVSPLRLWDKIQNVECGMSIS